MKTNLLILLILGISLVGFSQDKENPEEYKTLFGSDHMSHGGYGGLSVNYSQIDGKDAILVGARGAWVINHSLMVWHWVLQVTVLPTT